MGLYSLWIAGAIAAWLHGHSGASHLVVVAEVEDVMEIEVLNVEDVVRSHFTVYGQQGVDHEKKEEDAQRSMVNATKNCSTEKHRFISWTYTELSSFTRTLQIVIPDRFVKYAQKQPVWIAMMTATAAGSSHILFASFLTRMLPEVRPSVMLMLNKQNKTRRLRENKTMRCRL